MVAFDTSGVSQGGGTLCFSDSALTPGSVSRVVMGGYSSVPCELPCGVPKGSILFPVDFNIYIKLLGVSEWR